MFLHDANVTAQLIKKSPRLDVGTEVEGRFRGLWTLFVYGSVVAGTIWHNFEKYKCAHVYFHEEAKANDWEQVETFLNTRFPDTFPIVTIESTVQVPVRFFMQGVFLVVPLTNNVEEALETIEIYDQNVWKERVQVRIDTYSQSYVCALQDFRRNSLQEILKDETVWTEE